MRFLALAIFFLSFTFSVFSQNTKENKKENSRINKGDVYYSSYSFDKSIDKYENLKEEDKTIDIKRKLAVSYYRIGDYEKSQEYWQQVVEDKDHNSEDIYNYASVLAINKNYEESERWMSKFYALNNTDSRAINWHSNSGFYKALQENKGIFTISNLGINSKQQDFGAAYYKDKVVYASSRARSRRFIKRVWNWNRLPFLDIYIGKSDSSMEIRKEGKFGKEINKRLHDGPASFNKSGDFMVFTRNNYDGKSSDNIVKLQLFSSRKLKNNKWSKPLPFKYNSREYSVGHASLTASGDTMYFASDMPGGLGGADIYVTYRESDTSWTKPKNLGKNVNTEGDEMFPFIHDEGSLFFASDGHLGLGGLDIFVSDSKNGEYGKAENLGVPVNSSHDDFAFILNQSQTSGYFSSNRPGGKGDDDIYSFKMLKPIMSPKQYLRGKSLAGGLVLPGTNVYLMSGNDTVASVLTGSDGKYEFEVEGGQSYSLLGTKTSYIDGKETFKIEEKKDVTEVDVLLSKVVNFKLHVIVTNSATGQPIDGVNIALSDQVNMSRDNMFTSASGDAYKSLSDKKMQDQLKFMFSLSKSGYVPKSELWTQVVDREGVYEVRISLDEMIEIPPIYFDYNKSNIRRDASVRLDEVVDIMNRYPEMVVELSSYTDCRGTARYNMGLSDRRAKSSARYIRQRLNNNPNRIYGKGYGETGLVNDCACEGAQRCNCSEREHQLNRRTEFVIKKIR